MSDKLDATEYYLNIIGDDSDTSVVLSVGTTYYITIIRSALSMSLYIYSDASRQNLVDTLTMTVGVDYDLTYTYLYVGSAYDIDLTHYSTGEVAELNIGGFGIGTWETGTGCGRTKDIKIEEGVDFETKGILGKDTPTVNPDNYVSGGKKWIITMRMTKAKRDALQAEKDRNTTLMFVLQAGEVDYVKFEDLNSRWAGQEDFSCPWLVTVTLVSVLY